MTDNGYQVGVSAPVEHDEPLAEARRIGADLATARAALADAMQRAEALTPILHADGVPETEIAQIIGVSRMTVRKWLGKR